MGGFMARAKQGIRIKTKKIERTNGGVERESTVSVVVDDPAKIREVKLGVRLATGQRVTKFEWPHLNVLPLYDAAVAAELNAVDKFKMDGEEWAGWRVPSAKLPGLNGFKTAFGLSPAIPEGQTVMWAVVYHDEPFSGDHVYIGYADVTPPPPTPKPTRRETKQKRTRPRATKQTRKKR